MIFADNQGRIISPNFKATLSFMYRQQWIDTMCKCYSSVCDQWKTFVGGVHVSNIVGITKHMHSDQLHYAVSMRLVGGYINVKSKQNIKSTKVKHFRIKCNPKSYNVKNIAEIVNSTQSYLGFYDNLSNKNDVTLCACHDLICFLYAVHICSLSWLMHIQLSHCNSNMATGFIDVRSAKLASAWRLKLLETRLFVL